jgi:predicted TIM-barrel fold metal-dependent hydrolase
MGFIPPAAVPPGTRGFYAMAWPNVNPNRPFRAFSSEVGTGSREENPQIRNLQPGFDLIETEKAPRAQFGQSHRQIRRLAKFVIWYNQFAALQRSRGRGTEMSKLKLPNIEDVVAIDIHTHAEEPCGMHGDDGYDDFQAQMADYFKSPNKHPPTVPETAAYYRAKKIAAVIFPVDAERETGFRRYNNYEMLEVAADNSDVLIPFASIDPHKGKLGVREARKLIEEYGVRGFKFHPTMQGFYPNDRMAYPLYEAINDGGAIALFHTGQTGVGSGMPGGMGMRLKYSNPMFMDDVAADFPDLKIILAHPSFPWQEEALSVATHKPNVYIDLSGWSPNSILQDKMLFGSDWPVITPDRWLADFAKLDIRDEIRPKVLKANARKLLGI